MLFFEALIGGHSKRGRSKVQKISPQTAHQQPFSERKSLLSELLLSPPPLLCPPSVASAAPSNRQKAEPRATRTTRTPGAPGAAGRRSQAAEAVAEAPAKEDLSNSQ